MPTTNSGSASSLRDELASKKLDTTTARRDRRRPRRPPTTRAPPSRGRVGGPAKTRFGSRRTWRGGIGDWGLGIGDWGARVSQWDRRLAGRDAAGVRQRARRPSYCVAANGRDARPTVYSGPANTTAAAWPVAEWFSTNAVARPSGVGLVGDHVNRALGIGPPVVQHRAESDHAGRPRRRPPSRPSRPPTPDCRSSSSARSRARCRACREWLGPRSDRPRWCLGRGR